jgi:protocatechuate 4,5-dioxygenase alpha chain
VRGAIRAAAGHGNRDMPMMQKKEAYEDIPGTWVFDAQRARKGYHLNQFLMSLMKKENRTEFLGDERKYLMKFPMTEAQREAVLKRDWNTLLELGGVSYALAKLAFTDGHSYQYMAAEMTGMSQQEYLDMMLAGGRSPEGWRSKSERKGK